METQDEYSVEGSAYCIMLYNHPLEVCATLSDALAFQLEHGIGSVSRIQLIDAVEVLS